ncbi:MAG: gliding motility-associated C-terminal domain-containing protein [Flavobacteriales bacterium]
MRLFLYFILLSTSALAQKYTIDMKLTPIPNTGEINGSMVLCNKTNAAMSGTIKFFWPSITAFGGPSATINGNEVIFTFQSWELPAANSCKTVSVWGGKYSGNFVLPPYALTPNNDTVRVIVSDPNFIPKSYNANPWKYYFSKDCFIPSPSKLCLGQALIAEWSGPSNLDKAEVRVPTNRKSWALAAAHTHRLFTNMVGAEITSLNYVFAQSMIEGRMGCDATFVPAGGVNKLNFRAGSVYGGCFQILPTGWSQLQQFYPDLYNNASHPLVYDDIINGGNFVTACLSKAMYDYTSFVYWEKKFCYNPIDFFHKAADPFVAEEVLAYAYHDGSEGAGNILKNVFTTQRAAYRANPNVIGTLVPLNGTPGLPYGERMRNNLIQLGNEWSVAPSLVSQDAKQNWGGSNPAKPAHYQNFGCYNECFDWSDITSYIDEAARVFWHADVNFVKSEVKKVWDLQPPFTSFIVGYDTSYVCVDTVTKKTDPCADPSKCVKLEMKLTPKLKYQHVGCINYEDLGPIIDAIVQAFPGYSAEKGFGETYFASACPSPTANLNYFKGPICQGEKTELYVNLFGSAPFSYSVQGPNGAVYTKTNVSNPTDVLLVSEPGEYKILNITDKNGSIFLNCHKASVVVPKKTRPNAQWDKINVGKCQVGCQKGGNLKVNFTGGTAPWSIQYRDAKGVIIVVNNITTSTYTVLTATVPEGTYTLLKVSSGPCDTLLNDVIDFCTDSCTKPTATISGTKSICNGDSAKITVKMTGSAPFKLYLRNAGVQTVVDATDTLYTFYAKTNVDYTIDSVVSGKCFDVGKGNAKITVVPINLVNLGNDTSLCAGANITLNAGAGYTSYVWSNNFTTSTITVALAGKYFVTVKNATGCSASDTINITTSNSLKINVGKDTTLCEGASLTLDAGKNFSSYVWLPSNQNTQQITVNTAGTYIVNVLSTSGCAGSDTINISIENKPNVNLGSDQLICAGPSVSLANTAATGNYLWLPGNETTSTLSVNKAGTYILELTSALGCKNRDTVEVSLAPALNVSFANDTVQICAGNNITLQANYSGGDGNYTYAWTGVLVGSAPLLDADQEGWYFVTASDGKGCKGSDSIFVKESNALLVQLNDREICAGDSIVLDAQYSANSYSILWNTGATTSAVTLKNAGVYGVEVNDGSGCSGSDSMLLTVHALPILDLGADKNICEGTSVSIGDQSPTSGWNYLWNTAATSSQISVNQNGKYSLQITDANQCKNTDTISVRIIPLPTPDVLRDTVVCSNNTLTFDASSFNNGNGAYTYLWHNNSKQNNITLANINASVNGWVDITDVYGCKGRDNFSVTIKSKLPLQITAAPDSSMCEGESVVLSSSYAALSGFNFHWSTGESSDQISVKSAGTISLTIDNGLGCTGSDNIVITLHPKPNVSAIDTAVRFCAGETVMIGKDVGNNYSYLWNNGALNSTQTVNNGGVYVVEVSTNKNCKDTVNIVVTENQNPVVDLGDDVVKCVGEVLTITSNNISSSNSYVWNTGSTQNAIAVTSSGAYSLVLTDSNNCSSRDNVNVKFNTVPVVDLLNGNDSISICSGQSILLNAGNSNMQYLWSTNQTSQGIIAGNSGFYEVIVSNANCKDTDRVYVNVIDLPSTLFNHQQKTVFCFAEQRDGVNIQSTFIPKNEYQYSWSTGEKQATIIAKKEGTYSLTLSQEHCEVTDRITLVDYCESSFFVPNAVSPNGDHKNDIFKVEAAYVENFEMFIFNRWGELIFQSNDVNQGWNGHYQGNPVQQDVYVYKIRYSINKENGKDVMKERIGTAAVLY